MYCLTIAGVSLLCGAVWFDGDLVARSGRSGGSATARFVVALAFPANRPEGITWPYESLPRAPYDWLVLVVDEMPRAWTVVESTEGAVAVLGALRVGGLAPPPAGMWTRRVVGLPGSPNRHFRVRLDNGRLRISLASRDSARWRNGQGFVRVRLYDVSDASADGTPLPVRR